MIRRWHVEPDMEVQTADGDVLAISREALIMAAADACVMADRAGGGFSMWFDRFPTGLPGEMVTTGAIVEWRDRTDAKAAPERQSGQPQRAEEPAPLSSVNVPMQAYTNEPPPEDDPTQYHGGELRDDIGDGLDPATLEEEDESALEEEAVR
jgi:hypothetical protein